jgi:hypothetical protein
MTRIEELTIGILDGTGASEVEWLELEKLLASDPAALGEHLPLLELEGTLRGLRTEFDLSPAILERVREVQSEKTTRDVMAEIATLPAPAWAGRTNAARVPRRWPYALAGLLAVAAALLLGIWLGERPATPTNLREAVAVARLTSSHGAVELLTPQGDILPLSEGSAVPPGHTLQTVGEDSIAHVEMPDSTTLEIEPNSVVRFVSVSGKAGTKPRLFLASGQLTAAVPAGVTEQQLVVGTGVAEVFARTGTFVVSSAGPESTRVDVKQGNVDVVRMDARLRIPVLGGSAVVQSGFDRVLLEPPARVDRIPARSLPFSGARTAVFSPDGMEVWVSSSRQFTRWTRDGGTADLAMTPRKGWSCSPAVLITPDRNTLITSLTNAAREEKVLLRRLPQGDEQFELDLKLCEARLWMAGPETAWFALVDAKPHHRRLRVLDGRSGVLRFSREFEETVGCLAASADGDTLAAALSDPARGTTRIAMLDPRTGERRTFLPTQKKGLTVLAFSADGRHLGVGFNGVVQVWDVRSRELVRTITGFERMVGCLAFDASASLIAAGTQDGQVWLWSLATGKAIQHIEVGGRGVRSIAFSPDSRRIVTVAGNSPVAIWDVADASIDSAHLE